MKPLHAYFLEIDDTIRSGNLDLAKFKLSQVVSQKLNATSRVSVASFYRRLGLHQKALAVLKPAVIGSGRKLAQSSAAAKIEYGAALIQMDLVEEGRSFLNLPDSQSSPDARRWHALSFLHDFQMQRAAEEISAFLQNRNDQSYDSLVLKVNLLVALLGQIKNPNCQKQFQALASEVKLEITQFKAVRLKSAFESIYAQMVFLSCSDEVLSLPKQNPKDYLDFFKVFMSVFHNVRSKHLSRTALENYYLGLRSFALCNNWLEGLREIDFHYARTFRPELLPFVKMGTRHRYYQLSDLGGLTYENAFCFSRQGDWHQSVASLNAFEIRDLPNSTKLKQLFQLFFGEQYTYLSTQTIWSVLMRNEYYIEPYASDRVHQWVRRLKAWLISNTIPAKIISNRLGYSLVPKTVLQCNVALLRAQNSEADLLLKLHNKFSSKKFFKINDLSEILPTLSRRELQYRLAILQSGGWVERTGKARAVRYHLTEKDSQ